MSYKYLFEQALSADPARLHFAAHSHHLWPDAARGGHMQAFDDGQFRADDKWDHFFGHIWPAAQAHAATELSLPDPSTVVFAPNTHNLLVALFSSVEKKPVRLLTSDGEFHSLKRQADRWVEAGTVIRDVIPVEPVDTYGERLLETARTGNYDIIFTSHVFFNTGHVFDAMAELAALASPAGPWIVIDGYHGFMALPTDLSGIADKVFYLAGGYKYAMSGEGCAFLHAPPGFAERPEITGWYAAFGDLVAPPGGVGYTTDAMRLIGATFDTSGIYRFVAVRDMLAREGLDTAKISAHTHALQEQLLNAITGGKAGALSEAKLINPLTDQPGARFLALEHENAQSWQQALHKADVVTDVRGDVLRIGVGLYHDAEDVAAFCSRAANCL